MDEIYEDESTRRQLQGIDSARFEDRAERAARTQIHGIIPQQFFSAASSECRELFIDAHFPAVFHLHRRSAKAWFGSRQSSRRRRKEQPASSRSTASQSWNN
jgi:hypothetical protein